jgi:mRNA interferase MazF
LIEADFSDGGGLRRDSFIRTGKLFTANEVLILGIAGHLTSSKLPEVISHMVARFSSVLEADTL